MKIEAFEISEILLKMCLSQSVYTLYASEPGYSYTGANVGDEFAYYHSGSAFTTYDQDNDQRSSENCAEKYKGAYWYYNCYESNLNGLNLGASSSSSTGMRWYPWAGSESLKSVYMAIK